MNTMRVPVRTECTGLAPPPRIGVFGIGNLLRSDDGFGPRVIQEIEARLDAPADVRVADLGSPGLDLASYVAGLEVLILIDTVILEGRPGQLWRLGREELLAEGGVGARGAAGRRLTQHDAGFADALWLAEASGRPVGDVVLIGVTPGCLDQGLGLSAALEAAIEPAIAAVQEELCRVNVTLTPRASERVRNIS